MYSHILKDGGIQDANGKYHAPAGSSNGGQFTRNPSGVVGDSQLMDGGLRRRRNTPSTSWDSTAFKKHEGVTTLGKPWEPDHSSEVDKTLNKAERIVAGIYAGDGYRRINSTAVKMLDDMDFTPINPASKKMCETFDAAIDKSSMPEDVVLYRGMTARGVLSGHPEHAIGQVYEDGVFKSTSMDPDVATRFAASKLYGKTEACILEIKAPKGSKGLYMGGISTYGQEKEVVLPRSAKLLITGFKKAMTAHGSVTVYEAAYVMG